MNRWAGIARMGGLGDNLVAASGLRPLKKLGYMTEFITSENYQIALHNNPFLDKLSVKRQGDLPEGRDWQKWFISRGREYDIFAHLSHSIELRHAMFTDSTAFWTRSEYRRKICAGSYLETVHDILGVPYEFGPLFFPTDEEYVEVKKVTDKTVGSKYAVWVVRGSRVDKLYQYSGIAIGRMIKEHNIPIILMGSGDQQHEIATQLVAMVRRQNSVKDGLFNAVQKEADPEKNANARIGITTSIASSLVMTPDTGTAWAVAFEPMHKIMLLSHASPENITKHWINTTTLHADPSRVPCWPCHRLHDDISTCVPDKDAGHGAACMADISADTIVRDAAKAWNKPVGNVVPLRAAE